MVDYDRVARLPDLVAERGVDAQLSSRLQTEADPVLDGQAHPSLGRYPGDGGKTHSGRAGDDVEYRRNRRDRLDRRDIGAEIFVRGDSRGTRRRDRSLAFSRAPGGFETRLSEHEVMILDHAVENVRLQRAMPIAAHADEIASLDGLLHAGLVGQEPIPMLPPNPGAIAVGAQATISGLARLAFTPGEALHDGVGVERLGAIVERVGILDLDLALALPFVEIGNQDPQCRPSLMRAEGIVRDPKASLVVGETCGKVRNQEIAQFVRAGKQMSEMATPRDGGHSHDPGRRERLRLFFLHPDTLAHRLKTFNLNIHITKLVRYRTNRAAARPN